LIIINNDRQLKQSISFLSAALLTAGVLFCLSFVKNQLDIATIMANYNLNINDFVAEKSERYQYIFGMIVFPVFYILAKLYLNKKSFKNPQKYEYLIDLSGFFGLIILAVIIMYKIPRILELFIYIPNGTTDIKIAAIAFVISVLTIVFSVVFLMQYNRLLNAGEHIIKRVHSRKKFFDAIIYCIAAINLFFIFYLYITKTYFFNFYQVGWHFDAYFYPVYKVFCGQTPLVDFNCLYGFYPYFLVPLLKLTGGISMLRFSAIMASILVISLLAITIVIFGFCKNKILALIGSLAVSFIIGVCPMLYNEQLYYLQYTPHRVIFPALILLVCFIIVKSKNNGLRKIMTIFGYILSTLSLLWNIDTGAVVLLAFAMFQIYLLLLKYGLPEKKLYFSSIKIILSTILSLSAALLTLILITYARTGQILKISSVFYAQTSFYGLGYFMLRMPLWSTWLLFVILYAVLLARALSKMKFLRKSQDNQDNQDMVRNALYFVLPVIGMGIFSYYQGRSHFLTFLAVMWPGIILLVILMDEYLCKPTIKGEGKKHIIDIGKLKLICVSALIASLAINYIAHAVLPTELQLAKDKEHNVKTSEISGLLALVKPMEKNNEQIDLVAIDSAEVYCILGDKKIADIPATIDWFTKDDYQKVFNYLMKTNNKVIIDQYSMDLMKMYEPEKLQNVLERFILVKHAEGCWVYTPKN